MKIKPLAFESMGTRGMATSVVTRDCILLIDPGVNLASRRFGLPPHPMEVGRRRDHWAKIKHYAEHSDILILTHYHFDHFNPEEPEIYRDKTVIVKDSKAHVNRTQRVRAEPFLKKLRGLAKETLIADGGEFNFGETRIRFSPAVSHGPSPKMGYVVQVCIQEDEEKFLHTSDVQGPATEQQRDFVLQQNAQVVFCDGPVTYLLGRRYSQGSFRKAVGYLREIVEKSQVKRLVLDHHLLRELKWKSRVAEVFSTARSRGVEVLTAAEFAGVRDDLLEARRRQLYGR
jgi:predicted metallo-beta-lactamase superfamily hydrolase